MDLAFLKNKAEALRKELSEVETAISVFERYTGQQTYQAVPYEQSVDGASTGTNVVMEPLPENTREGIVYILRRAPGQRLRKQEIREGLKALGINTSENTLTWTLSTYSSQFASLGGGLWQLR